MSRITKEEVLELVLEDTGSGSKHSLVVHNDEVNTFDHVINSLIDICKMEWTQAEQCSMIIHHKGKYAVRHGDKNRLNPMREALTDRGIGATID